MGRKRFQKKCLREGGEGGAHVQRARAGKSSNRLLKEFCCPAVAVSSSSSLSAKSAKPTAALKRLWEENRKFKDFHGNYVPVFKLHALKDEGLLECYSAWIESWPIDVAQRFNRQCKWAEWLLDLIVKVCASDNKEAQEELLEKVSDQLLIVWTAENKLTTSFLPQFASYCGIEGFSQIAVMVSVGVQRMPCEETTRRMINEVKPAVDEVLLKCSNIPLFAIPKIQSFAGHHMGLVLKSQKEFRLKTLPKDSTSCLEPPSNPLDTIPLVESVIEDVVHGEPAAHIPPDEAATVVGNTWASWVQHNAHAAEATMHQVSAEDAHFEPIYMLRIARATKKWQERLHSCDSLETLRTALSTAGHAARLPSGAALIVAPDQYSAVRHHIGSELLRPWHVVVSESLVPFVLEAVHEMPCRSNTRVSSTDVLAYIANYAGESSVVVTVEKTFLHIPRPMHGSASIVQSTGDAHGTRNPRRIIPTMPLSDA